MVAGSMPAGDARSWVITEGSLESAALIPSLRRVLRFSRELPKPSPQRLERGVRRPTRLAAARLELERGERVEVFEWFEWKVMMDLSARVYKFEISLSDIDRDVFEHFELRLAPHELETPEYLVTRILAYCLEYRPGICMARGLSDAREPALWVRDLTDHVTHWIEVGTPNAKGLHKASKSADHVIIYTHEDPSLLQGQLSKKRIYRARDIKLFAIEREIIDRVAKLVDRRTNLDVYISGREIFITAGGESFSGFVTEHGLD